MMLMIADEIGNLIPDYAFQHNGEENMANAPKVQWMEWKNRRNETKAFAIDPASEERTGKVRSYNGSLIPEHAVPAKPNTPKDEFCLKILESIENGTYKTKTPKVAGEKPARAAKAAKDAASNAKNEKVAQATEVEPSAPVTLKKDGENYVLVRAGQIVGRFPGSKLTGDAIPELKITGQSWSVTQDGKRRAYGMLQGGSTRKVPAAKTKAA